MTGMRFGNLTVIGQADDQISPDGRHRKMWLCQCDCGNKKTVNGDNLRDRRTISCGCFQKKRAHDANTVHGDTDSRLYNVWSAIKRRCYNSKVPEYKNYGGRGISMCKDWKDDYSSFRDWAYQAGYDKAAPRGVCTIDRIDNDGDYSPNNCRWVTQKMQMNNVRYNRHVEYQGESYTISQLAELVGIPYERLYQRIGVYGFNVEDAINKI